MLGRAVTPEEKREIVERVLRAWLAVPKCRLGQLLENANFVGVTGGRATLYQVEDEDLALCCELFASVPK